MGWEVPDWSRSPVNIKIHVVVYDENFCTYSTSMYVDHVSSVRWALAYAYYEDTLMHQRYQLSMGSIKKEKFYN